MLHKIFYLYYHHNNECYILNVALLTFTVLSDISPLREQISKALLWKKRKKNMLLELTAFHFEASADKNWNPLNHRSFTTNGAKAFSPVISCFMYAQKFGIKNEQH